MNDELVFQFIRDKSQEGEYFLEIADKKGNKRRICVNDIEDIEPTQGKKFCLHYHVNNMATEILSAITKQNKTLRTEQFQSTHLAEIMDCFEQVLNTIEEQEQQM